MIFQPAIPLSGVAGLRFLERTEDAQRETFDQSPLLAREVAYFRENIADITTAEELVNDRQLLKVALGAFGLDSEIDKKFFMRKMLEEGTEETSALAIRFTDPRYRSFVAAFGFGNAEGARTGDFDFAQRISDAYLTRQFEAAIGEQDPDLRLAMAFKREIADLAALPEGNNTAWFAVLGSRNLRAVVETAFGLPSQFSQLDVDVQRETLQDRARDMLGSESVSVFADPEKLDQFVNQFLARAQINSGPSSATPGFAALTLLQGGGGGGFSAIGQINLILSNAG